MDKDIERIHERIDKLGEILNEKLSSLSTKLERHLAKMEVTGTPGNAPQCDIHRQRIDTLQSEIDEAYHRINGLEKAKLKMDGFKAGVAFVWSAIGAILMLIAQYLIRKFS